MKRSLGRRAAMAFAGIVGPILPRFGLSGAMQSFETYTAFLNGRGAGSGWDHHGQVKATASFVPRSGSVIFDVGANNGAWSEGLASVLGEDQNRFFLFECADYCFPGIEERNVPNMTLIKCAVSSQDGTAILHLPTRGSGLASLHARRDVSVQKADYVEVAVPTRSLDSVAEEYGIIHIDLLKMDIEGHELEALKGAKGLLKRGAIQVLVLEFGSANVNSRTFFRDFWDLLTKHGFVFYRIVPGGGVTNVTRYTEELEYFRGATNYIATLKSTAKPTA